jgi:hypothetical protein
MKGAAWQARVHEEQKRFAKLAQQPEVRRLAKAIEKELEEGFGAYGLCKFGEGSGIEVGELGTLSWSWRFVGEGEAEDKGKGHVAGDLCTDGKGHVWAVEEGGSGDESYSVSLYRNHNGKGGRQEAVWKHAGVGPYVAVCRGRCFALEVRKRLVCFRLVSWDAMTGEGRKVHYEIDDSRYNLELFRSSSDNLWLKHQAGAKLDVFCLNGDGELQTVHGISLDARSFVMGSKSGDWSVWTAKGGWQVSSCLGWRLPALSEECNPEQLDTERGFLVTKHKGQRCLWKIWQFKAPEPIWKGVGQIKLDPWGGPWIRFVQPGHEARWWNSQKPETGPPLAARDMVWGQAEGGAPYVLLSAKGKKAKGLFLAAYGAYGIESSLETYRWEPLRKRGFAVGLLLLRGGGDDSPTWEHSGRVKGRELVLQEAETTVRTLQAKTGIGPDRTCLYGRSAGGLWAGGLTAKFPDGDVAGFVYMEVPYLDVVRTTTNRALPLTEIETDEFGLPSQRLSDLVSMMRWSPMELLALTAGDGVRGVWQLVRTGVNDSQVYAYESMKWVTRCRGPYEAKGRAPYEAKGRAPYEAKGRAPYEAKGRAPYEAKGQAILAIEDGQGHFMHGAKGYRQKAVDLALLLQAFQ